MLVVLDNGHGVDTPGKCSPDKSIREYEYARRLVQSIYKYLVTHGFSAHILVPESTDIPLRDRCKRVNDLVKKHGKNQVLLVSVHLNAASNGDWSTASGWEVHVSPKGSSKSKELAEALSCAASYTLPQKNRGVKSSSFYILNNTLCPAVLTENLFMDSRLDCYYLLSDEGFKHIVDLHINGIVKYLQSH